MGKSLLPACPASAGPQQEASWLRARRKSETVSIWKEGTRALRPLRARRQAHEDYIQNGREEKEKVLRWRKNEGPSP